MLVFPHRGISNEVRMIYIQKVSKPNFLNYIFVARIVLQPHPCGSVVG